MAREQTAGSGRLTTHVLDTARGRPAEGVPVTLHRLAPAGPVLVASARTNADGRCDPPLLAGPALVAGTYELVFEVGAYFAAAGSVVAAEAFLDLVPVRFRIVAADAHYHVPLLIAPFGYATYRGS